MRSGSALETLGELAERVRPVTLTRDQRLPVSDALSGLLPGAGLRKGSTVAVSTAPGASGTASLALALVAEASAKGAWVAAVGMPSLGLVAAAEMGVALERLVMVAAPERGAWGGVAAALVDGFDIVLLHSRQGGVRPADARRVVARARERGTVLLQLGPGWDEGADVALEIQRSRWEGLDGGYGHLEARKVRVVRTGRGEAAQPARLDLWLPDADGRVSVATPASTPLEPPIPLRSPTPLRTRRENPSKTTGYLDEFADLEGAAEGGLRPVG